MSAGRPARCPVSPRSGATRGRARGPAARAAVAAAVAGAALAVGPVAPVAAQSSRSGPSRDALVASLDSAARAHAAGDMIPGVSVAVVHRGETLLQRGYGYVDLEWQVETPADGRASYEIGSITKQFTAAAVMLLVEQGEIDLEADFTDYVDFDTQGHRVPVRRLLDHTSGIKGYTEMPVFGEFMPLELPRDSLLRVVEQEPFEFDPGRALIYNNSAYFILGLVIEEVTGGSYGDFVRKRLFEPAGMDDSYYCSQSAVRARRAHGYDAAGPDSLIRARYLDHTWPYAAGSLCSTVGDLVRWNLALHGGEILSPASYRAMTTPEPLSDGTPTRYAMGLGVDESGGRLMIAHGGGINGFLSDGRYYPDDELVVVVLQNATGAPGPASLSSALTDIVLGPAPEPPDVTFRGDLGRFTGTYSGPARGRPMTAEISIEDGGLAVRINGADETVHPAYRGGSAWGFGNALLTFVEEGGTVRELRFDQVGGHYVLAREGG